MSMNNERNVNTRRVALITPILAAFLSLLMHMGVFFAETGNSLSYISALNSVNIEAVLLDTPLYTLIVFPLVWLGGWWELNDRPLPKQITKREYQWPIRCIAVFTFLYSPISIFTFIGSYTGTFEPVMMHIFSAFPPTFYFVVLYSLLFMIVAQIVLGILIWFDYRHLSREDNRSVPLKPICGCFCGPSTFGLTALAASWYWLRYRRKIESLDGQPEPR